MTDEERDACPALLALYHPFVWHAHFPGFPSGKYTYPILGLGKILTALSRLRWRTRQSISRGSLGVQWLDILLLRPRFNAFSRGFPEGYSRRRFLFVRSLFDDFLIVANGTFSPLCRRFTLTAPACPSSTHRCESKERNASPYRFTERSFWLCHFGICKCPILCHSGIVWRSTSSRTMPKRHNQ